jgi:hypothetical protein
MPAVHATLSALRHIDLPLALFRRHAEANPEFDLVISLVRATPHEDLAYDLLDAAFLLRWNELIGDGALVQELAAVATAADSAAIWQHGPERTGQGAVMVVAGLAAEPGYSAQPFFSGNDVTLWHGDARPLPIPDESEIWW